MTDNMTPGQRRRTMSSIRRIDTKPELAVRRLAFARGLRYRKYSPHVAGKPDLVFARARLVVFIDGDFWHGWRFQEWEHKLSSTYWRNKIRRNIDRDKSCRAKLEEDGWLVLQIWEHEIEADASGCVDRIEQALQARLQGRGSIPQRSSH
jgi:DNA mismatch endonuclease (patch repair protein)